MRQHQDYRGALGVGGANADTGGYELSHHSAQGGRRVTRPGGENMDGQRVRPTRYCGLGVCADQSGLSGGVLGAPTCWLSGRMHAVWSPDGPQDESACMPYLAKLSRTVADLARNLSRVCRGPRWTELVGVGGGCQQAAACSLGVNYRQRGSIAVTCAGCAVYWARSRLPDVGPVAAQLCCTRLIQA